MVYFYFFKDFSILHMMILKNKPKSLRLIFCLKLILITYLFFEKYYNQLIE